MADTTVDPGPDAKAPGAETRAYFALFNEIAIIDQLGRAMLEARLPDGLIQPHFAVVSHLIRVADGCTPLELARAFQVPKTTMTHTIAGLERHGLVEVRPNPDDGRSKRVWLSPAGRAFRDRAILDLAPIFERLKAALPPEAAAAMMPGLETLRMFLDAARETPARNY